MAAALRFAEAGHSGAGNIDDPLDPVGGDAVSDRSGEHPGQRIRITSSASCSTSHGRSTAVKNSADETQTKAWV